MKKDFGFRTNGYFSIERSDISYIINAIRWVRQMDSSNHFEIEIDGKIIDGENNLKELLRKKLKDLYKKRRLS